MSSVREMMSQWQKFVSLSTCLSIFSIEINSKNTVKPLLSRFLANGCLLICLIFCVHTGFTALKIQLVVGRSSGHQLDEVCVDLKTVLCNSRCIMRCTTPVQQSCVLRDASLQSSSPMY